MGNGVVKPTFFKSAKEFRVWLEKHHAKDELVLGFFKVSSRKGGITHKEALDEALCYGWIDGVGKNLTPDSYTIRFSPRRAGSHWSRINIKRAHELTAAGLMHAVGLAAFERRDEGKTINYSYELREAKLTRAQEKRFKENKAAWAFFSAQAPSYQRHGKFYVSQAKQEETRERRLDRLIAESAAGRRLGILNNNNKSSNRKIAKS
jgi:uncharacterized protein YdeI (YjbR/CyaY-like superfamily)